MRLATALAFGLAAVAAWAVAPGASASHTSYASGEPAFECGDLRRVTWMGADAGSAEFHNGAIKGYAEGDWVPFRAQLDFRGGTLDGACTLVTSFDFLRENPTAAMGYDLLRTTGLSLGDVAFDGCSGTVSEVRQTPDGDRIWVAWDLASGSDGCTLRIDGHLTVSAGGHTGASGYPGCSLHAHLTAPPGQRDRCVKVEQAEGEDDCPGPEDVQATARDDLTNEVTWSAVAGASGYNVHRATGSGSFGLLAGNVQGTSYVDEDVDQGVTYRYRVTAIVGGEETEHCGEAEATAIPDLPTAVAGAMATLGGLGAYAAWRRR